MCECVYLYVYVCANAGFNMASGIQIFICADAKRKSNLNKSEHMKAVMLDR